MHATVQPTRPRRAHRIDTGATVGYFRELSPGPVSVVVPFFGMSLVGGALLGIALGGVAVILIAT